jgi:hypothetical protein
VHANLVEEIARQLAPKLRPKYLALTNQRVVVTAPDPIELPPASFGFPLPIAQRFVEIRDRETRSLVTVIEVLIPTNKRGEGMEMFRKIRQEFLQGKSNFVEVDLLRVGERFPVPGTMPSASYFVFLSRADRRPRVEIWAIALDQPLPQVPVPLLAGDADVFLDLQLALNSVYDLFAYDQAANHSGNAPLPLAADQLAWAEGRLKQAGLRS